MTSPSGSGVTPALPTTLPPTRLAPLPPGDSPGHIGDAGGGPNKAGARVAPWQEPAQSLPESTDPSRAQHIHGWVSEDSEEDERVLELARMAPPAAAGIFEAFENWASRARQAGFDYVASPALGRPALREALSPRGTEGSGRGPASARQEAAGKMNAREARVPQGLGYLGGAGERGGGAEREDPPHGRGLRGLALSTLDAFSRASLFTGKEISLNSRSKIFWALFFIHTGGLYSSTTFFTRSGCAGKVGGEEWLAHDCDVVARAMWMLLLVLSGFCFAVALVLTRFTDVVCATWVPRPVLLFSIFESAQLIVRAYGIGGFTQFSIHKVVAASMSVSLLYPTVLALELSVCCPNLTVYEELGTVIFGLVSNALSTSLYISRHKNDARLRAVYEGVGYGYEEGVDYGFLYGVAAFSTVLYAATYLIMTYGLYDGLASGMFQRVVDGRPAAFNAKRKAFLLCGWIAWFVLLLTIGNFTRRGSNWSSPLGGEGVGLLGLAIGLLSIVLMRLSAQSAVSARDNLIGRLLPQEVVAAMIVKEGVRGKTSLNRSNTRASALRCRSPGDTDSKKGTTAILGERSAFESQSAREMMYTREVKDVILLTVDVANLIKVAGQSPQLVSQTLHELHSAMEDCTGPGVSVLKVSPVGLANSCAISVAITVQAGASTDAGSGGARGPGLGRDRKRNGALLSSFSATEGSDTGVMPASCSSPWHTSARGRISRSEYSDGTAGAGSGGGSKERRESDRLLVRAVMEVSTAVLQLSAWELWAPVRPRVRVAVSRGAIVTAVLGTAQPTMVVTGSVVSHVQGLLNRIPSGTLAIRDRAFSNTVLFDCGFDRKADKVNKYIWLLGFKL